MGDITAEKTPPLGDNPNQDLYCVQCGYNLRGLSGDPRRCPECGHDNPMSELTIPAEAISRALRQMETAPTACVAAGLVLLLMSFFLLLIAWAGGHPVALCPLIASLCAALIWVAGAAGFRKACGGHPSWVSALFKYHLYGLGAALAGGGAIIATGMFLSRRSRLSPSDSVLATIDIVLVFALVLFGWWARRDIKSAVDPIQRELAVKIAREEIERSMHQRR